MLKALYDFKASLPKTLSFHEGELFVLLQSNVKQKNWWQVVNASGQVGYIPYNYVASIEVTPQFFREFIDKCLTHVDHEPDSNEKEVSQSDKVVNSEPGGGERREVARKLRERLEALVIDGDSDQSTKKKKAPAPPPPRSPLSCLSTKRTSSTTSLEVPSGSTGNCNSESGAGQNETEEKKTESGKKKIVTEEIKSVNEERKTVNEEKIVVNEEKRVVKEEKKAESVSHVVQNESVKSDSSILSRIDVPKITYRLVEEVRHQTHLSHTFSKVAVQVVVEELERQQNLVQELASQNLSSQSSSSTILSAVLDLLTTPPPAALSNFVLSPGTTDSAASHSAPALNDVTGSSDKAASSVWWGLRSDLLSESYDARRLRHLLRELAVVRGDEQQRSWAVHEDEIPIIQCVTELISILEDADANVCRLVLCEGELNRISSLIEYFQMETRWSIRHLLLKSLSIMCDLHRTPTILMLNSVLPMELARDMKSNPKDVPRLKLSSLLLIRIFSIGEVMPIYHFEHLGEDFISFLIDRIEEEEVDLESELGKEQDEIPDLFLTLLLAYNLQFKEQCGQSIPVPEVPSDKAVNNPVLSVLKGRTCAKALTEKALLLINREEDPVGIFQSARHATIPTQSVIKLVGDLFGDTHTAALFYTNDTKVLIDILVRQLSDLSPGDQDFLPSNWSHLVHVNT
ncbi:NCK-interacting protein with SH3 domain isoform X2 [Ischnura elegans]|uniref:NCK-interacting protein with SH3 domain isoform X2 n=1 Tax=Ischnura elegans TaxID=197161 RepID=UPI001ED87E24|nr:NCK-interacting protein with SH3 domain isoform X2 [Ischnura elegans]